ncbi:hypothetical protein DM02DRAFT_675864 [Periconia macrospinosa]|uniref:Uncharacterized protein n=1 Tax=Periconia macrospinosa TaxID=97972 RepID=A0A2V1DBJ9_9PLEO|nr:hypothetical protein DM02DRAFT_675864 [Periconia macrospinosa]
MDPFTAAGSVPFAGIASCFKLAEFAVNLAEVGAESQVFIRLIQIVRIDLLETERLLSIPTIREKLERIPHKLEWARSAIHNTKFALSEIGRLVEDARVDQQAKGTVQFSTRVRWVLQDHSKIMNRQAELSACHQQLSNVLQHLAPLELHSTQTAPVSTKQELQDKPYHAVIAPRQRRKSQLLKQKSMITITDTAENAKTDKPAIGEPIKEFYGDSKTAEEKHTRRSEASMLNLYEVDGSSHTRPEIRFTNSTPSTISCNSYSSLQTPLSPPPPYSSVAELPDVSNLSLPVQTSAAEMQPSTNYVPRLLPTITDVAELSAPLWGTENAATQATASTHRSLSSRSQVNCQTESGEMKAFPLAFRALNEPPPNAQARIQRFPLHEQQRIFQWRRASKDAKAGRT